MKNFNFLRKEVSKEEINHKFLLTNLPTNLLTRKRCAFTLAEGATHVENSNSCRKIAFTLAEVLITLGIIGIVAAVTMPTLINEHKKRVYVTQLKTWYSEMSNVVEMYKAQSGSNEIPLTGDWQQNFEGNDFIRFLDQIYYIDVDCDLTQYKCYSSVAKKAWENKQGVVKYYNLQGGDGVGAYPDLTTYGYQFRAYQTKKGATFGVAAPTGEPGGVGLKIVVDVNGPKTPPNIVGRDTFYFYINEKNSKYTLKPRLRAAGNAEQGYWFISYGNDNNNASLTTLCDSKGTGARNGSYCSYRIIQEGWKMNY